MRRAQLLLSGLLIACEQDVNVAQVTVSDEFDQAPSNAVDILWVVDDSTSMKEEQAAVRAAGQDFLEVLESADMDFQIGLITTDGDSTNTKAGRLLGTPAVLDSSCREDGDPADCTYAADLAARFEPGTGGSDQEKGLEVALRAVQSPLSETFNDGFVRDGALLMIIQLTDENDCSDGGRLGPDAAGEDCYNRYSELTPVGDLVSDIRDAKAYGGEGEVLMSGIIGPDASTNCSNAVPGKRYREAIGMFGGVEADICLSDYAPVMQSLGLVATGIMTNFQLSKSAVYNVDDPATTDRDESEKNPVVEVGGAVVAESAENGWTYVDQYAQIRFNGDAVPERAQHIIVTYYSAGPVPTGG
ncbi:MAG: hypothetical protein EXR71_10290 [Myxococcales bacterium]|nr:hypothetical protein [Myxococcales bacterium]